MEGGTEGESELAKERERGGYASCDLADALEGRHTKRRALSDLLSLILSGTSMSGHPLRLISF
jgi:hypothetical protein